MSRPRVIGLTLSAATVVALAVLLVVLAPVQVGGRVAYVITSGSSMEPTFHAGDLVLTRTRDSYAVGDIVLYRSHELRRDVLHRIVARDGARFVTQGDNNGYRDPEHPTVDQIRGEAWVFVPGAGRALVWLRRPVILSGLAFVVVLGLLLGGREVERRRRPGSPLGVEEVAASGSFPRPPARALLAGALVAGAVFASVAVVALGRPLQRTVEVEAAWRHSGTFAYTADVAPSAAYPDGEVVTGETVFTSLVRRLRVSFDYAFAARGRSDVRGAVGLQAVVSDGLGWTRSIPVRAAQPFAGSAAHVDGVLDVQALRRLVERVQEITGTTATSFTVTLAPTVEVAGVAGADLVDETYAPTLALTLDPFSLRPAPGADGAHPAFDVEKEVAGSEQVPAALALGPASVSVERARSLALLGVGLSSLVALAGGMLLARERRDGETARIRALYGGRIVEAVVEVPADRWLTELDAIDDLARVAERYDRVILRDTRGACDAYYVDDGVALYRYRGLEHESARLPLLPARLP